MDDFEKLAAPQIYDHKSILIGTLMGGPLAAGYLMSQNYKIFGKPDSAQTAFFLGIIITILYFGGILIIPAEILNYIPKALVSVLTVGIVAVILDYKQDDLIQAYIARRGAKASRWKAAGIGVVCSAISFGYFWVLLVIRIITTE